MEVVDGFCELLQTHVNRDKVVNLTFCGLLFASASTQRKQLAAASARVAAARSTLRLFDDAAAIKAAISYGLGKQDGLIWGPIGVAGSVFTLSYLQMEKVSWLVDVGVITVSKDTHYWIKAYHKLFASLYAFVGLLRSIRALHAASKALKSPHRPKCAQARFTLASLTTTKVLLDVVYAVSWLPPGWLWGGLSARKTGSVGALAAAMGIIIHFQSKKLLPR